MTRTVLSIGLALSLACGFAADASAAKAKAKPAAKGKGKVSTTDDGAPAAASDAISKVKGDFKWGMTPDEVVTKVQERTRAAFDERLKKTSQDPSKQDRVRKDMMSEVERVKDKYIKFDGQKTGYDVSIIDQEFLHGSSESMLVAKEENATRYFFFSSERLYKMFIAFDKEMLQGKSFRDFGQLMQAQYGKAKEVSVEEKTKAGVRILLDHFVWSSKSGDMLRLVDRSEFYDVYCLVIYDGAVAKRQDELRRSRKVDKRGDSLVEAVTSAPANDRDANDNIVDQITGKQIKKPGEQRGNDIVVPSVTPASVRAPTPAEVNRRQPAPEPEEQKEESPGKPVKKGKAEKPGNKPKGDLDGLAL